MIEDFEHGDAPDLFYGRDFDYRYWGKAGILSDMSPYITDDIENSLTPGIRDLMLRNDGCYQIFSSYALMGFYGKEEYFGADNEVDISKAASVAGSHDIPLYCELCSYDIVDMAIRYEVEETPYAALLPLNCTVSPEITEMLVPPVVDAIDVQLPPFLQYSMVFTLLSLFVFHIILPSL